MNSSSVLKSYLLANSSFERIVSFDQFKSLFPKNYDIDQIKIIHEDLKETRQAKCLSPISRDIDREFEVPIFDIGVFENTVSSSNVSVRSLRVLISKLEDVIRILHERSSLLQADVSSKIKELEHIVENMTEPAFQEILCNDDGLKVVEAALETVQRCESIIEDSASIR